jgi:SAM-dependent methyltransferase
VIEIHRRRVEGASDSEDAYDALYSDAFMDPAAGHFPSRYIWLVGLLRSRPGLRLLDVSCGNGYLLRAAGRRGLEATGVDISPAALEHARRQAPHARLVCADAERLPFGDTSFDRVTNIGSLEHYARPQCGVAEMARVLKPDGLALVLLPNAYGLFGNIQHVWRHGEVFIDDQPLQRYATRASWARLLEENGFSVVATLRYERELPRTWGDLWWYLRRPLSLIRALASPLIPLNLSNCFVFICRRST